MRYWLFKSEPGCFSFQDLQERPESTEHWDGVRNFQARNFLRDDIAVGDQILFYHSSIAIPAVIGLCTVVRSGYPDHTAQDPTGEHFDPKATPQNPIWYMVDVKAIRSFPHEVPLSVIKEHPKLQDIPLVKRSRLSVQPVSPSEFETILTLANG